MRRVSSVFIILLAAFLAAPTATAVWRAYGTLEPDTSYDELDGYMWTDAPGAEANRIYLSVAGTIEHGPSPNSATLGSRLTIPGTMAFVANLGVWADCNHDGYIGMADGAMREYRAEVNSASGGQLDLSICPVVSEVNPTAVQGSVHNDGNWITEMIPIGPAAPKLNARYIQDPNSRVWLDNLLPVNVPLNPACADEYYVDAISPGATGHVGGVLHSIDCRDGFLTSAAYGSLAETDPTGTVGGLGDPTDLYADGGPLDLTTFGSDKSCRDGGAQPCDESNSIVSGEQDCSSATIVESGPIGDAFQSAWRTFATTEPLGLFNPDYQPIPSGGVRSVGIPKVNPTGTIPATVNETVEESPLDDCDSTNDGGHDFYGATEATRPDRNSVSDDFAFLQFNNRYGCLGATARVCGMPNDAGIPAVTNLAALGPGDYWYSVNYVGTMPGTLNPHRDTRGTLTLDASAGDPWTFYANVNVPGAIVSHPSPSIYGAAWCTDSIGANAPAQNHWACDPALWTSGAKVGDPYNLRDVDCYDGTLVGASMSPTHADVGLRSVPGTTDPASVCT